jgi:hypothetical protein
MFCYICQKIKPKEYGKLCCDECAEKLINLAKNNSPLNNKQISKLKKDNQNGRP